MILVKIDSILLPHLKSFLRKNDLYVASIHRTIHRLWKLFTQSYNHRIRGNPYNSTKKSRVYVTKHAIRRKCLKDSGPPSLSFWGMSENKEVALPPARFQVRFRLQKWAFQKKTRCQVNDLFFLADMGRPFVGESFHLCGALHSAKARVKRHAEWN